MALTTEDRLRLLGYLPAVPAPNPLPPVDPVVLDALHDPSTSSEEPPLPVGVEATPEEPEDRSDDPVSTEAPAPRDRSRLGSGPTGFAPPVDAEEAPVIADPPPQGPLPEVGSQTPQAIEAREQAARLEAAREQAAAEVQRRGDENLRYLNLSPADKARLNAVEVHRYAEDAVRSRELQAFYEAQQERDKYEAALQEVERQRQVQTRMSAANDEYERRKLAAIAEYQQSIDDMVAATPDPDSLLGGKGSWGRALLMAIRANASSLGVESTAAVIDQHLKMELASQQSRYESAKDRAEAKGKVVGQYADSQRAMAESFSKEHKVLVEHMAKALEAAALRMSPGVQQQKTIATAQELRVKNSKEIGDAIELEAKLTKPTGGVKAPGLPPAEPKIADYQSDEAYNEAHRYWQNVQMPAWRHRVAQSQRGGTGGVAPVRGGGGTVIRRTGGTGGAGRPSTAPPAGQAAPPAGTRGETLTPAQIARDRKYGIPLESSEGRATAVIRPLDDRLTSLTPEGITTLRNQVATADSLARTGEAIAIIAAASPDKSLKDVLSDKGLARSLGLDLTQPKEAVLKQLQNIGMAQLAVMLGQGALADEEAKRYKASLADTAWIGGDPERARALGQSLLGLVRHKTSAILTANNYDADPWNRHIDDRISRVQGAGRPPSAGTGSQSAVGVQERKAQREVDRFLEGSPADEWDTASTKPYFGDNEKAAAAYDRIADLWNGREGSDAPTGIVQHVRRAVALREKGDHRGARDEMLKAQRLQSKLSDAILAFRRADTDYTRRFTGRDGRLNADVTFILETGGQGYPPSGPMDRPLVIPDELKLRR